jgi:hypothetical protein
MQSQKIPRAEHKRYEHGAGGSVVFDYEKHPVVDKSQLQWIKVNNSRITEQWQGEGVYNKVTWRLSFLVNFFLKPGRVFQS